MKLILPSLWRKSLASSSCTRETTKPFKKVGGNFIFPSSSSPVPLTKFFMSSPASFDVHHGKPYAPRRKMSRRGMTIKMSSRSLCCRRRKMKSFIHWMERQVSFEAATVPARDSSASQKLFSFPERGEKRAGMESGNLCTKKKLCIAINI